jgi:asparagine synthase (glutamine-hydrolysing)
MDGRIDNWEDLRKLLTDRGAPLRTQADEELVLQAYLMFGEDCGKYLEGDYAIVLWDNRRQQAFCLRDHFAHKPFHYSWNGTTLSIASEVKALLKLPWVSEQLDEATIAEFLEAKWYSREASFWSDIRRLTAASQLVCNRQELNICEYWRPDPFANCPINSEGELAEYYLDLFTSSVRRRSRSHRPVAYEVSGGLDSSATFAVALDLHRNGKLLAPDILGYTLKFENDHDANDLPYARSVARHLAVEIKEIAPTLKSPDWYKARVQAARDFMGYPNGFMNLGILQEARSDNCSVLIDGIGGDEWLTGDYRLDYADAVAGGNLPALKRVIASDLRDYGPRHVLAHLVRYGFGSNLPRSMRSGVLRFAGPGKTSPEQPFWVNGKLQAKLERRRTEVEQDTIKLGRRGQLPLERTLKDPFRSWVYELNDRDASRQQIERRAPFDDKKILELAYSLPLWMSRNGRVSKYFHRRAMKDLLPSDVLSRRDKAVFSAALTKHTAELGRRIGEDVQNEMHDWLTTVRLRAACQIDASLPPSDMNLDLRLWALWGASGLL